MNHYPIFYSFRRCPYAMRARMALQLNQVHVALREVVLKDKPASLLSYSPKGTVPVLAIDDNFVIEESLEIMKWTILRAYQSVFDLPCSEESRLIDKNDQQFKVNLDKYKYFDRFPDNSQEYYREKCEMFLYELELRLIHQQYLFGDKLHFADIAIFPFIRQFASVDQHWFDRSDYPKLKLWLTRLINTKAFKSIMNKYPQWQPSDPAVIFP